MPKDTPTKAAAAIGKVLFAACRRVTACRVDISVEEVDGNDKVRATYRLDIDPTSAGRYVLLDNSWSRTGYRAITDSGGGRDLTEGLGERIICVDLMGVANVPSSITVHIEVPWDESPFFEPWSALPRVLQPREERVSPIRRHFFVDSATHARFPSTGLQLGGGEWDPVRQPQLELVLLRKCRTVGGIVFAGQAPTVDEPVLKNVARALDRHRAFLAEMLGVAVAGRLGTYAVTEKENVSLTPRTLFVLTPKLLGIGDNPHVVATQLVATTTRVWWGGGVFLSGNLGMGVSGAVSKAMELYALEVRGETKLLEVRRRIVEQLAAKPLAADSSNGTRAVKLSNELGLPLYAGLSARQSVREELRSMTREYWGTSVSPHDVLRRLASVGVEPPSGLCRLSEEQDRWA